MKFNKKNKRFVKVINFLFGYYKKSFYSGQKGKRTALGKMERKVFLMETSRVVDREVLFDVCRELKSYKTDAEVWKQNETRLSLLEKKLDLLIERIVVGDWHAFRNKFSNDMAFEVYKYFGRYKPSPTLAQEGLIYYYQNDYLSEKIKAGIKKMLHSNPIDDYPVAREMKRHFVLHIGPTNSGKTYQSLERLKECEKGIYLGPLRLLALEVYDKFNRMEVPCNLVTGEESSLVDGAVCQASTIEMLNTHDYYDIAVVDEAQMIADTRRGHNWTRAILGLQATEIHVCMAKSAENIVKRLIELCEDTYEVHYYERMTPLSFEEFEEGTDESNFIRQLKPGDAVITFSKGGVLGISAQIEKAGLKTSVIYGNLPPTARKYQVELFSTGETEVVVATDAIGMGINLPIKRIVFSTVWKFDGIEKRILNSQEVKQIAGRAGRRGIYEEGFCASVEEAEYVRECLTKEDEEITIAPLGFPDILLELPFELHYILQAWAEIAPSEPFSKMDVAEVLELYKIFRSIEPKARENISKQEMYNLITCPLDTNERLLKRDFKACCRDYNDGCLEYDLPDFEGNPKSLYDWETYYKRLDFYYQISRKTGKIIREEELKRRKHGAIKEINRILKMRDYYMEEKKKRSERQVSKEKKSYERRNGNSRWKKTYYYK